MSLRAEALVIFLALVLSWPFFPISNGSGPVRGDPPGNDDFASATDIYFQTDPLEGDLSAADVVDFYRINDLEGDDQYKAQRLALSLKRDSGTNVKGVFYEPNGMRLGNFYSSGEKNEIDLFIPYDGDYYLSVSTDPVGQSAGYTIMMGGEKDLNNHDHDDGNNRPGAAGFTGSTDFANTLNPLHDIVDYYYIDVPPEREVEASFQSGSPMKLDVMNETFFKFTEEGPLSNYSIRNTLSSPMRIVFRMYYPLTGGQLYQPLSTSYVLSVVLWSPLTTPQIEPADPWTAGLVLWEDQSDIRPINLTRHFFEPNGDVLSFKLVSTAPQIGVQVVKVKDAYDTNKVLWVEARLTLLKNWFGEGEITFMAMDKDGTVNDTIRITVETVDDLPYITRFGGADYKGGTFNMLGLEDTKRTYAVSYGDDDDPFETLFFTTNESFDFVSVEPGNGTTTVLPDQEDVGVHWFNISLMDGSGGYKIVDIRLTVEAVNDAPPTPEIRLLSHNTTFIPPGEEIRVEALSAPDIDGDILTFTWDWSDGTETVGETSSHTYPEGIYGDRTLVLTVSDGYLEGSITLVLHLQRPEDLAKGDLLLELSDPADDAVSVEERWKIGREDKRELTVSTIGEPAVDILGLRTQRRGNQLEVQLRIKETIQITGAYRYHVYIIRPDFTEPKVDFKNISAWDSIPDRKPLGPDFYVHMAYLGDPNLFNRSRGTIIDQHTLLFLVPFSEMVKGGLSYPLDRANFTVFAVVEHQVNYTESKGQASRFVMTDTAGIGALMVGHISPLDNTSGRSSPHLLDLTKPTNIIVVVAILLAAITLGVASYFLVRKQIKEKKEEEEEFLRTVEQMRAEGRDLFGKEKEEQTTKKVSYEELYGGPAPEGHVPTPSSVPAPSLPGPGLGTKPESESHIVEVTFTDGKGDGGAGAPEVGSKKADE